MTGTVYVVFRMSSQTFTDDMRCGATKGARCRRDCESDASASGTDEASERLEVLDALSPALGIEAAPPI